MKPAAGIVGMIAHPLEGTWKSVQKPWAKKQDSQQLATRVEHGQLAFEASTDDERQAVVDTFKRLTKAGAAVERKKTMEAEAQEMLKTDASRKLTLANEDNDDEKEASQDLPEAYRSSSPELVAPTESKDGKSHEPPPLPARRPGPPNTDEDDEAAFQRDLDLAMQLSLAEQQGYERGLKHAQGGNH